MGISVIIVNYNVRHFLEQCLVSVFRALEDIDHEVIVVDNNSTDGSVSLIKRKFPEVKLIVNRENIGFGAANNKALKIAKGRYILLLNPDTVIEESTIRQCVDFMEEHPDAGAAGVKMIDGKGRFLPESKRALPDPATAFYKIFGISRVFPHSGRFNKYYLGNLSEDVIQKIEVLTGAFFFTRKEILDKVGFFDESFFMYGEDIDLSYRILKEGYSIYYLPEPSIIHYKGESTSKGTLNYVIHFYRAMMIFIRKHFSGKNIKLLIWIMNIAIFLRASLSYIISVIRKTILPVIEYTAYLLSYLMLTGFWETYSFNTEYDYPPVLRHIILPVYTLVWIVATALFKGYNKPLSIPAAYKGIFTGSVLILVIYALLPLELRFSRALIMLGTVMALLLSTAIRAIAGITGWADVKGISKRPRNVLIISKEDEYIKIKRIIESCNEAYNISGRVSPSNTEAGPDTLGNPGNIDEVIRINSIDEIIFSSNDLSTGEIIETMKKLAESPVLKKIARTESEYVIGSNSKLLKGEIYSLEVGRIY